MKEPSSTYLIRLIERRDNPAVKDLVLKTLAEFNLHGEGYAGVDDELEDMYSAYKHHLSAYYVVEYHDGQIQGVGGYAPLLGTEPGTIAELRKMYLSPQLRGQGIGQRIIEICINAATEKSYQSIYLETVPSMKAAQKLYLKNDFEYLKHRLGHSGHNNCDVCMMRKLQ